MAGKQNTSEEPDTLSALNLSNHAPFFFAAGSEFLASQHNVSITRGER